MKVRLYRGPFNGKVMEHRAYGANEILLIGPKPMTRKQRYEWQRNQCYPFDYTLSKDGKVSQHIPEAFPRVKATYKICIGPGGFPMRHPDGSLFYEWDQPRPGEPR